MNIEQIKTAIAKANITIIVGPPCAGKTFLAELLKPLFQTHKFIHTDDYILKFDFKTAMYEAMNDMILAARESPVIVEGIQTARMLRKSLELKTWAPDLIIEMDTSYSILKERYSIRNAGKAYPDSTLKSFNTVFAEYMDTYKEISPQIIIVDERD